MVSNLIKVVSKVMQRLQPSLPNVHSKGGQVRYRREWNGAGNSWNKVASARIQFAEMALTPTGRGSLQAHWSRDVMLLV